MKTNNEEKHNKDDRASKESFDSSNNNNQERRAHSDDKDEQRRPRRPRVGDKAYVADPKNRHSGPTRTVSTSRFSSPDRNRDRDRNQSPDRYSSDRGNRDFSSDRGNRFSSSSDRGDRYSSPDRGNRYPSERGDRDQGGYQPRERRSFNPSSGPKRVIKPLIKKKPFKQIKYKENADPNAPIRLNKYLANAGICSRREADDYIQAGAVKVNGVVVKELGSKIIRADEVTFNDKPIQLESKVYVLLNKPKGFVTTTDDPENRKTVMDLVKSACEERIYPVGR